MMMKKIFFTCFILQGFAGSAQTGKDSLPSSIISQENRQLVFDSIDLKIIQRADALLSDTSKWHKKDDRVCEDDMANGKFSLFCALYKASIDIIGKYEHRRNGMQQVRFVLEKYEQGRVTEHRLKDWNNHPDTTFEEIKKVLREAIAEVSMQLVK